MFDLIHLAALLLGRSKHSRQKQFWSSADEDHFAEAVLSGLDKFEFLATSNKTTFNVTLSLYFKWRLVSHTFFCPFSRFSTMH